MYDWYLVKAQQRITDVIIEREVFASSPSEAMSFLILPDDWDVYSAIREGAEMRKLMMYY